MSSSSWQALVVNEVNEYDLFHGRLDGTEGKIIPVKTIQSPVEDPSTVAVVSWRWDGTDRMVGSRNVFCAIHQARKMGIEYLFIDVVSIDQRLSGDELISQGVDFSKLHRTVQIIAAYDEFGVTVERTISRPWIFSEVHLYRHNPA
ncbi:hypothetical protein DL98DRAFT_532790 [Cadophora sp. DSE1049]|nr:hypothetical protein DL98DRAFT_532790 [Cadophora sp. DSE1049]